MTLYSLHSVEFFLSSIIGLNSPINSRRLLDDIDFISLYIHLILSLIINHHDNDDQAAKGFYRDPQYTKYSKQECIPVGCVPSAVVAVCWGGLPGGGCLPGGGGYLPRGCLPGGCITAFTEADTPPGQNSWHTLLTILSCHNFVADGNYYGWSR